MGLTRLVFENDEDRKIARDIHLAVLEAEGWKPGPDLDIILPDERAVKVKQQLAERGVTYRETDY
jgi:hypothetical protein